MPDPIDISLEISIGTVENTVPIDVSINSDITQEITEPISLDLSLDLNTIEPSNIVIPSIIEDIQVDDCGCDVSCDTQNLIVLPNKPPIGIVPSFSLPSVVIHSLSNPVAALVPSLISYDLRYTQNDAGTVTSVVVKVDGIAVHTGGLVGSFTRTLSPGIRTTSFDVHYSAGSNGYDSNGNPVPNPIVVGVLQATITFNSILPFYSGTATNRNEIPNTLTSPQVQNLQLNTGTLNKVFWFATHSSVTIDKLEDSNAMYIDLKGLFTYVKTILLSGESYIVMAMSNAIPYKTNHKFEFHVN